jgi:hypothetical protein
MAAQFDAMTELTGTFKLLFQKKNWMLAVPILVSLLVAGIVIAVAGMVAFGSLMAGGGLAGAMAGGGESRGPMAMFGLLFSGLGLLFVIAVLAGIVIAVFGYGWAYAAAEPLWKGGDPDIGGGFNKALAKLGSLVVLALIVGIVDALLFWTVIVPILIFFFCIYTIPYVMQTNQSGAGAIGASINLAKDNFGPTALLFVALIVVGIVAGIVNGILGLIPLLGQIIAIVVGALVGAYTILAVMRFYNLLTGSATAVPVAAPPPPTTPTP